MVYVKPDPSQRWKDGFSALCRRRNGIDCLSYQLCGLCGRHKTGECLSYARIGKIDLCCIPRRVQFNGARKMLNPVLHAMALKRLPLVMPAQKKLICLAVLRGFGGALLAGSLRHEPVM